MTTATAERTSQLRCPRCGARLARDQDWCLECGAAATTRILRPPSWKLAAAIVAGVVAVFVVAVVLVIDSLSGDADRAAATRARGTAAAPTASTPARAARPAGAAAKAATAPSATGAAAPASAIAAWPSGKDAWTVVLATASSRPAAEQRARKLIAGGVKAGVLDTAKFNVDSGGAAFVVFSGQFASQAGAIAAESRLRSRTPAKVFVAQVSPR